MANTVSVHKNTIMNVIIGPWLNQLYYKNSWFLHSCRKLLHLWTNICWKSDRSSHWELSQFWFLIALRFFPCQSLVRTQFWNSCIQYILLNIQAIFLRNTSMGPQGSPTLQRWIIGVQISIKCFTDKYNIYIFI